MFGHFYPVFSVRLSLIEISNARKPAILFGFIVYYIKQSLCHAWMLDRCLAATNKSIEKWPCDADVVGTVPSQLGPISSVILMGVAGILRLIYFWSKMCDVFCMWNGKCNANRFAIQFWHRPILLTRAIQKMQEFSYETEESGFRKKEKVPIYLMRRKVGLRISWAAEKEVGPRWR